MQTEMLHIDPKTCIDCGACVEACPVDAIRSEWDLTVDDQPYLDLNSEYFELHPLGSAPLKPVKRLWRKADYSGLRVAIVGSGPAAFYAALEIQQMKGAQVDMFERLLTPYGLVRFGVAPDHPGTKSVIDSFRSLARKTNFNLHLGVEIGTDATHEELLAHHHAVIYAVGASSDRRLCIEGEDLTGSHTATEFVAWYNGHPDYADRTYDLSSERVVIVGSGNVALDVARILLTDPEELDRTDIADHALDVLRTSKVQEIVVLCRRGVAQAAYTNPEMLALRDRLDIDLIIDSTEVATDELTESILGAGDTESSVRSKVAFAQEVASETVAGQRKRLVIRFLVSPTEICGTERVESVRVTRNRLERKKDGSVTPVPTEMTESIETGLVLRAIGYRGVPMPGVPFDDDRGVIPNVAGRVVDPEIGETIPGIYATGWIKRGPSGVIGTNRKCATDTVDLLLQDYLAGKLPTPQHDSNSLTALISARQPETVDFAGWARIDKAETAAGRLRNRPRVKFVDTKSIMDILHD